jgi:hypothetical protein
VDAVLEELEDVVGVEGDDFENPESDRRKRGPEERCAACPSGDEKEPAPDGGVPEGVDREQMVEEHDAVLGEGKAGVESGGVHPPGVEDGQVDEQHDGLRDDGDGPGEEGQKDEGDGRLGEDRGEVGDREGLPEENAAIAALAVESVEGIEDSDEEGGRHDEAAGDGIDLDGVAAVVRNVSGSAGDKVGRDFKGGVGKAEEDEGGYGEGRDVDGTVLPEFAADAPEEAGGFGDAACGAGGAGGVGERCWQSVGLRGHWAAPVYELGAAGGGVKGGMGWWSGWPTKATKTSAMVGVRRSPRGASCSRGTPSKRRMVRPKTWRS